MPDTLIARLESAGEGNRELDAHLFAMAQGGRIHWIDPVDGDLVWEKPIDGMWIRHPSSLRKMPAYTTSLDAAIALVTRLLPGAFWQVNGSGTANVDGEWSDTATPALALVLATLKALEARDNRP